MDYGKGISIPMRLLKNPWFRIVLLLAITMTFLHACAERAFYIPTRHPPVPSPSNTYKTEEIRIPSQDGEMGAWVLDPIAREPTATVVFCHGNAGNLENHIPFCDFLPAHGFRVLMFDYRGYGASTPIQPSRETTLADVYSAVDYATRQWGKPWLFGQSLGGSLALIAAGQRNQDVKGVVCVAAFTSYRAMARDVLGRPIITKPIAWPLGFLVRSGEEPIEWIDKISPTPILLIHGKRDEIVPTRMSQTLYEKAKTPKDILLLDNVRHNDDWRVMGRDFVNKVIEFLTRLD